MNQAQSLHLNLRPPANSIAELAMHYRAAAGHFDEVRGEASAGTSSRTENAPFFGAISADGARAWSHFFQQLTNDTANDMEQRSSSLARQVRDNGITYNVYADENGPQRSPAPGRH